MDNPVWYSLCEEHKKYAVEYEGIKFYDPAYCPFGGFAGTHDIAGHMHEYSKIAQNFYMVGDKPLYTAPLILIRELVCKQMVAELNNAEEIVRLGPEHTDDLFWLVNLVQPGYFKSKTAALGSYYGIYKDGILAAVPESG